MSKRYSTDRKINSLVCRLLNMGNWSVRKGKKHSILIAPNNRRIAIPSTPSDYKAFLNFSHDVKLLSKKEHLYG